MCALTCMNLHRYQKYSIYNPLLIGMLTNQFSVNPCKQPLPATTFGFPIYKVDFSLFLSFSKQPPLII